MKKINQTSKIFMILSSLALLVSLNGCYNTDDSDIYSGGSTNYESKTLFLEDEEGNPLVEVPYLCDSMNETDFTTNEGAFTFLEIDNCEFNFKNFDGSNDNYGSTADEGIYIVDEEEKGINRIKYSCESYIESATYKDGSFEYEKDDVCTFEFK